MSDFFEFEGEKGTFSPIIKIEKGNMSPTLVTAIDNLLCPRGDIFSCAQTVKNLMAVENLSLENAAKSLGLRKSDVANKLRLLEYSQKERNLIIKYGYSEREALMFLNLDKVSRLYAMEYCKKREFNYRQIQEYVTEYLRQLKVPLFSQGVRKDSVRKFSVCDPKFLFNSIEKALKLARQAGLDVEDTNSENDSFYTLCIKVKKK